MIVRSRAARAASTRVALSVVLSFSIASVAIAGGFSAEKSAATLTVTYHLTGGGEDLPASHERHVVWSVDDTYVVTATMTAAKATGFAAMHKAEAGEKAREADRMQAANAAASDMSGMMAQAQKIMEVCGDDEACIQRETIKMSQNVDMSKVESARGNIAKASAMPDARYQMFSPKDQSGTFRIEEKARVALFDAACSLATEARCMTETVVRGEGAQNDGAGKTTSLTNAVAEYDAKAGSLIVTLAVPAVVTAKKTVASKASDVRRAPLKGMTVEPITVACGACASASGKLTKSVEDELTGRKAKLDIEWTFSR